MYLHKRSTKTEKRERGGNETEDAQATFEVTRLCRESCVHRVSLVTHSAGDGWRTVRTDLGEAVMLNKAIKHQSCRGLWGSVPG